MDIDHVTGVIVDAAVKIHRDLGSGLFESVYELALSAALQRRGLRVIRQQPIGLIYEGVEFEHRLTRTHRNQLLTYLRLGGFPVGLVLNFGAGTMKEGIKRLVNDLPASVSSPLRVNRP
jgi:hypothetical protein